MKIIPKAKAFTKVEQGVKKKKRSIFTHVDKMKIVKKKKNKTWFGLDFFFIMRRGNVKIYYIRTFIFLPTTIVKKSPWNNIKSNYEQMPK